MTDFEVVGEVAPEYDVIEPNKPTTSQILGGVWQQPGLGTIQAVGGLARWAGDLTNFRTAQDWGAEVARNAKATRQDLMPLGMDFVDQAFSSALGSVGQMLPWMFAGGPVPGIIAAGVQSSAETYSGYRDYGFSGGRAAFHAGINGLAEAAGERISLPVLWNGATKGFAKQAIEFLTKDMAGEQLTAFAQGLNAKFSDQPGKTVQSFLDDALMTAAVVPLAAGMQLGVARGAQAIMPSREELPVQELKPLPPEAFDPGAPPPGPVVPPEVPPVVPPVVPPPTTPEVGTPPGPEVAPPVDEQPSTESPIWMPDSRSAPPNEQLQGGRIDLRLYENGNIKVQIADGMIKTGYQSVSGWHAQEFQNYDDAYAHLLEVTGLDLKERPDLLNQQWTDSILKALMLQEPGASANFSGSTLQYIEGLGLKPIMQSLLRAKSLFGTPLVEEGKAYRSYELQHDTEKWSTFNPVTKKKAGIKDFMESTDTVRVASKLRKDATALKAAKRVEGWAKAFGLSTKFIIDVLPEGQAHIGELQANVVDGVAKIYLSKNHDDTEITLAHEFGHALVFDTLMKADPMVQLKILRDWALGLQSMGAKPGLTALVAANGVNRIDAETRYAGGLSKLNRVDDSAVSPELASAYTGDVQYQSSFMEYLADRVAQYLFDNKMIFTPEEQSLYQQIADILQNFYKTVVQKFVPNTTFEEYLNTLRANAALARDPDLNETPELPKPDLSQQPGQEKKAGKPQVVEHNGYDPARKDYWDKQRNKALAALKKAVDEDTFEALLEEIDPTGLSENFNFDRAYELLEMQGVPLTEVLSRPIAEPKGFEKPYDPNGLWRSQMYDMVGLLMNAKENAHQLADKLDAWAAAGRFKKVELEWSGLSDYLRGMPSEMLVTRSVVERFLSYRGPQVRDVIFGEAANPEVKKLAIRLHELGFNADRDGDGGIQIYRTALNTSEPSQEIWDEIDEIHSRLNVIVPAQPMYKDWQFSGGTGYTELLLKLEQVDPQHNPFKTGHYSERNVLAHIRFNRRFDANGEPTLFVEEFQSDWAQQWRKQPKPSESSLESLRQELSALKDKKEVLFQASQRILAERTIDFSAGLGQRQVRLWAEDGSLQRRLQLSREEMFTIEDFFLTADAKSRIDQEISDKVDGIPNGPFISNTTAWTALALKRIIRYAADNGFKQVAWTTGRQQVDRYSEALQKAVDVIKWEKTQEGIHLIGYKDGQEVVNTYEKEDAVSDAIGKSMGEQIIYSSSQSGSFGGRDITVSDTGMAGYYDKILPNVAKDVLKKIGGGGVKRIQMERNFPYNEDADAALGQFGFEIPEKFLMASDKKMPMFSQTVGGGRVTFPGATSLIDDTYPIRAQSLKLQEAFPDLKRDFTKSREATKRFGGFLRKMLTAVQIRKRYGSEVPPIEQGVNAIERMEAYKARARTRADDRVKQMKAVGKDQRNKVFKFMMDEDKTGRWMSESVPNTLDGSRKLSPDIARKYGITEEGGLLYAALRKDFYDVLKELESLAMASMARNVNRDDPLSVAQYQRNVQALQEQTAEQLARPYVPHTRFGDFYVQVSSETGKVEEFYQFESKHDAQKWAAKLRGEGKNASAGVLREDIKTFAGLPPSLIQSMKGSLDLTEEQMRAFEDILKNMSGGQSFVRKMKKRKDIPGWADDEQIFPRVYADYMTKYANHAGRLKFSEELKQSEISLKQMIRDEGTSGRDTTNLGALLNWLQETNRYAMNPTSEWANIRGAVTLWYLGFSVKSAAVNALSVPMVTYPYLAQRFSDVKAIAAISRAYKDLSMKFHKPGVLTDDELKFMEDMRQQNILDESYSSELAGIREGGTLADTMDITPQGAVSIAKYYGMWMFHKMEGVNRQATALAAYRLARTETTFDPLALDAFDTKAADFAKKTVQDTQNVNAQWNRSEFMRGGKSVLTMFMSYQQNIIFQMFGGDASWMRLLAVQLLVAGMMGLPFAKDADNLIKWFSRKVFDTDASAEKAIREWLSGFMNDPSWVLNGGSYNVFGSNLQGSLGMGQVIPGLDALAMEGSFPERMANAAPDIGGPAAAVALNFMQAMSSNDPDLVNRFNRTLPAFAKQMSQGWTMFNEGVAKNSMGDPIAEASRKDAMMKMLGFQSTEVSKESAKRFAQKDTAKFWLSERQYVLQMYYMASKPGNREFREKARDALRDYNQSVPHASLRIGADDIEEGINSRTNSDEKDARGAPRNARDYQLYKEISRRY